jgi:hypothetical protein
MSIPYHQVCIVRQGYCLKVLDRLIQLAQQSKSPIEAKNVVIKYNNVQKHWENYDRRNGYNHDVFLKMNANFKDILNNIVDEMIVKHLIIKGEELGKKGKKNDGVCTFCFDDLNLNKDVLFKCTICKNKCHMHCIMEWLGMRVNQGCPFCRMLLLQ